MFTGLIEDLGEIMRLDGVAGGVRMEIRTGIEITELALGDSIAVDGTCLTAIEFTSNSFVVEMSEETLRCTRFAEAKIGERVNLERALCFGARLGGHLVQGHVDAVGKLVEIIEVGDGYEVTWELPETLLPEVVRKGSITIDGVSLTIARLEGKRATAAIIPHTAEHTTIATRSINSLINVESDLIGKYVRRVLGQLTGDTRANLGALFDDEEVLS
jgi:riboflavin synthase